MFQVLNKSYKGLFPFQLGTTSFIYPADWCTNARLLGPYVDEIELLFLESATDDLPTRKEIGMLQNISKENNIVYNVHLPYDFSLDPDKKASGDAALVSVSRVMSLADCLTPTTWTLHLPFGPADQSVNSIDSWRSYACEWLKALLEKTKAAPESISIETLHYPFDWICDIVRELNMRVCLDIGHLVVTWGSFLQFYEKNADIISITHLHGISKGKDHGSLHKCSKSLKNDIVEFIKQFRGDVSIEVFSFNDLKSSLEWLEEQTLDSSLLR